MHCSQEEVTDGDYRAHRDSLVPRQSYRELMDLKHSFPLCSTEHHFLTVCWRKMGFVGACGDMKRMMSSGADLVVAVVWRPAMVPVAFDFPGMSVSDLD